MAATNDNMQAPPSTVPDIAPSQGISADEMLRLQAMLGNGKMQKAKVFVNEDGSEEKVLDGDCDPTATIVVKDCSNGSYAFDATCTKIIIDNCSNCTFTVNGKVVTHMLESYKCTDCTYTIGTKIATFQTDICRNIDVTFASLDVFDSIIWAGTYNLSVSFDSDEKTLSTGFEQMAALPQFEGLREDIDQFIIRCIEGRLLSEKIVRLNNGFPSTAREIEEFEERQERNMRELAARVFGDDIVIPKRNAGKKKKVGRNDPCPCGSGKKSKKCDCTTVEL